MADYLEKHLGKFGLFKNEEGKLIVIFSFNIAFDSIDGSFVFFGTSENLKQCSSNGYYRDGKGEERNIDVKHYDIIYKLTYINLDNGGTLKIIKNNDIIDTYILQNEDERNIFKKSIIDGKTKVEFLEDKFFPAYLLKQTDDVYFYINALENDLYNGGKVHICTRIENDGNFIDVTCENIIKAKRYRDGGSTIIETENYYFDLAYKKNWYCNNKLVTLSKITDKDIPLILKNKYDNDCKEKVNISSLIEHYLI